MAKKTAKHRSITGKRVKNIGPINDLTTGIFDQAAFGTASPMSTPFQMISDTNYSPVSLNRILLNYAYTTFGIVQTVIDQPVEDGLRGGVEIDCDEMDAEDLESLQKYLKRSGAYKELKLAMRWKRLFGGAGLIINTDQDPTTALDIDAINEDTPLEFIAADRWELTISNVNFLKEECPYNYNGQKIHKTRVIRFKGKDAPSFVRSKLQGWGLSEVERLLRDINAYTKNQDVIFELLDEAKIDVWKIEDFNANMLSALAAGQTSRRLSLATMLKNYHNAIVMDKEDEYEQKTMAFSGLAEMMNQIRIGMAAAARMPLTKLFGLSAQGFNSGEDDIENYNAMIEGEIRFEMDAAFDEILPICCQKVFGMIPEHMTHKFKALRVLSSEQEENVKTQKFNRYQALYKDGMLTAMEYAEVLKKEGIQIMDTEVSKGAEPTPPVNPMMDMMGGDDQGEGVGGAAGPAGKQAKEPKKAKEPKEAE